MHFIKSPIATIHFLYPAFLYALSAIAIPIIIHLFNFRRYKAIYFTNTQFLKEVQEASQSKNKLKQLLILASRILFIIFLVFAFAQPYIAGNKKSQIASGENMVSIYIDNSFSMGTTNNKGTLLEEAKRRAKELLSAYPASGKFQLLTNDFESKNQRLLSKESFLDELEKINFSSSVKSLRDIISMQADLLSNSGAKHKASYILSDFQQSFVGDAPHATDSSFQITFIPIVSQESNNLYIDSCWFYSPVRQLKQSETLFLRIKNLSTNDLKNIPVKLYLNGKQRAPSNFDISGNEKKEITMSFMLSEPGNYNAYVELTDFPVNFDDKMYFSFTIKPTIKVLLINPNSPSEALVSNEEKSSKFISSLFNGDSLFTFSEAEEGKLNYTSFSNNNLIIINGLETIPGGLSQELKKFLQAGGSLFVFPSEKISLQSYNNFYTTVGIGTFERIDSSETKVVSIDYLHPLYSDVFEEKNSEINLPVCKKHYVMARNTQNNSDALLQLSNGDPFLSSSTFDKGTIYICSAPINAHFGNFTKHALFVPTLYKAAILSLNKKQLYYTTGADEIIKIPTSGKGNDKIIKLISTDHKTELIPEQKIELNSTSIRTGKIKPEAGNYDLLNSNGETFPVSFNYDRKESDLTCLSTNELINYTKSDNFNVLQADFKDLSTVLKEQLQGQKLWKVCITLSLLFLAIEILLIKLLKNKPYGYTD